MSTILRLVDLFLFVVFGREKLRNRGLSPSFPGDRLDAGQSQNLNVTADSISKAGSHILEVMIALESRWQWRSETFVFTTKIKIDIEGQKGDVVVNQTIQNYAEGNQTGITFSNPIKIYNDDSGAHSQGTIEIQPLIRATVYDQVFGYRGYPDRISVNRDATFCWNGFSSGHAPSDGPIATSDSLLKFGRARTKANSGETDVRILVFKPSGEVDSDLSQTISREHFLLFIQNGRLCLRTLSPSGVLVNGKPIDEGETCVLKNDSHVHALPTHPSAIKLHFKFVVEHEKVVKIRVLKTF